MSAFDDEEAHWTGLPRGLDRFVRDIARGDLERPRSGVRVLQREPERQLAAARAVLAEREAELLELQGPCRNADRAGCPLHRAHRGPCAPPTPASLARRDAAAVLAEVLERSSPYCAACRKPIHTDETSPTGYVHAGTLRVACSTGGGQAHPAT